MRNVKKQPQNKPLPGMLHIEGHRFSFEQLRSEGHLLAERFTEDQYKSALLFCHQWLTGKESFLFHTSGSTGTPKNITAPRRLMEASAQATIGRLGLSAAEHILVCLNTQFIAGAMMLARGMVLGCDMTVTEVQADLIAGLPAEHPYTFVSLVPLQLKNPEKDPVAKDKLNRFHQILIGGSALSPENEAAAKCLHTTCYHTYGMTETLSHIALRNIRTEDYFETMPGITIAQDDRGCLMIRGPVTADEWIMTNDLVTLRDARHFLVQGRADDVIVSGALKFFAHEIEAVIRETRPGLNFFITSIPDPSLGERIIMITEGHPLTAQEKAALTRQVGEKISPYAVPKQFLSIATFALTPTGKPDRKKTAEQALRQ